MNLVHLTYFLYYFFKHTDYDKISISDLKEIKYSFDNHLKLWLETSTFLCIDNDEFCDVFQEHEAFFCKKEIDDDIYICKTNEFDELCSTHFLGVCDKKLESEIIRFIDMYKDYIVGCGVHTKKLAYLCSGITAAQIDKELVNTVIRALK